MDAIRRCGSCCRSEHRMQDAIMVYRLRSDGNGDAPTVQRLGYHSVSFYDLIPVAQQKGYPSMPESCTFPQARMRCHGRYRTAYRKCTAQTAGPARRATERDFNADSIWTHSAPKPGTIKQGMCQASCRYAFRMHGEAARSPASRGITIGLIICGMKHQSGNSTRACAAQNIMLPPLAA